MSVSFAAGQRSLRELPPAHGAIVDGNKLFQLIFVDGNPSGIKALLNIHGKVENVLRLPLVPATDLLMKKMEKLIREYELC